MSSSRDLSEGIDRLFEHYLSLLDQYTTLRAQLSAQQISIQQNLARAKFHAPPGVQYGESMYDGRMQAQRTCRCRGTVDPESGVSSGLHIQVMAVGGEREEENGFDSEEAEKGEGTTYAEDENGERVADGGAANTADKDTTETKQKRGATSKPRDPIRMFGLLTPEALRKAQGDAIEMVEKTIPEICRINAEMAEVEIKIRRARKHRAKAEEKEQKETLENVSAIAGPSIEAQ